MTADLIAFLRARLDEDEAVAHAASGTTWGDVVPSQPFVIFDVEAYRNRKTMTTVGAIGSAERTEDRAHIVRWDPARVLRDIDAKRQILRALENAEVALRNTEPGTDPHDLMTGAVNSLRAAARMLAAVYADHPDYKEAWRP